MPSDRLNLQLCLHACSGWGAAPSQACPLLQGVSSAHQGRSQSPAPPQAPVQQPAAANTPHEAQGPSGPAGSSKAAAAAPDSCDAGSLLKQLRTDQEQNELKSSMLPASCRGSAEEVLADPGPGSMPASTVDAAGPSGLAPAEQQERSASAAGSSGPQPSSEAAMRLGPSCESSAVDANFQEQEPE